MSLRHVLAASFVLMPALAVPVVAQEADPEALSLLVEEALLHNPDVLAAREWATAVRERPRQAGTVAGPTLAVSYTNDGWSPSLGERDMTTLAFVASQPLSAGGTRRYQRDIATRDADEADLLAERVRLGVAASVRRAFWSHVLARELLGIVTEQAEVWKQTEGVARARYSVGQGAQSDVLRAQVELTRVEQRRLEQAAEIEIRRAELHRLVGRPPDDRLSAPMALVLRPDPRSGEDWVALAFDRSPEIRAGRVGIDRDSLALELARRRGRPGLALLAGYMNRGGLDPMWQAGLVFDFSSSRGAAESGVAEADARKRANERRAESARATLRYRTEERVVQLRFVAAQSRLYTDGILPQGRMSVEAAVASYQAGRVPFVSVLEALNSLYADRTAHARILADHERIRASLEEASLEAGAFGPGGGMSGGATGSPASTAAARPTAAAMPGMGR